VTVAILALAMAVVVAPVRRPGAVTSRRLPPGLRRSGVTLGLVTGALAVACLVPPSAAVALALVSGTVAWRRRGTVQRVRRASESAALQAALDVLAGELRAGAHPVIAFETAAAEVSEDVASALRAVAARARLGVDVAVGLNAAATRSTVPAYWSRLAACWELANRHGLAIATLMRTAHRDVVERQRFESRVTAGMAGARATAMVLAGLPVLGMALGQLIGADPVRFLLSGSLGGGLLVIGSALACAGLLWSDRITNRMLT
jgi:tight adherence protein B